MAEFNVVCQKGYGNITFLKEVNDNYCPVSGRKFCVECDVICVDDIKKDGQVERKKESQKINE